MQEKAVNAADDDPAGGARLGAWWRHTAPVGGVRGSGMRCPSAVHRATVRGGIGSEQLLAFLLFYSICRGG